MLKRQPGHIAPGTKRQKRKPRPIRCEPRWRAASLAWQRTIALLIELLESQEAPRQRRRRANDAATFRAAIECIACNLLAVSLAAADRALAVPLANAASRVAPIFGKPARRAIDLMLALGFVTKIKGYPYRGPTTIRPTAKLRKHLPLGKIKWSALRIQDSASVVVLKKRGNDDPDTDDDNATPVRAPREADENKQWLDAITGEMHAINAAILSAPIECKGSAVAHIAERPGAAMASLVTLHHRTLRRIFNGSWNHGGRLFGNFIQTMPKPDRFRCIRIDDEPIAIVDYSQLFLRLAYAEAGVVPPTGDLYAVTEEDPSRAGWKKLRDARKKLVNALFFRKAPLKQWPGATLAEISEMRRAFPLGTTPRDAIQAIKLRHAPIAHLFERGRGLRFMRFESDLIVSVTLALVKRGIMALPIHDAVALPIRHAEAARVIMQMEACRQIGANIPVAIQTAAT